MSLRTLAGGGEGRLGFTAVASSAFAFLLRQGFSVARSNSTLLRFESSDVFINIFHGRRSYQIGLEIGRVKDGGLYSLYEILASVALSEVAVARCQPTTREGVQECLSRIAELVEKCCQGLIGNDPSAFAALEHSASLLRHSATLKAQFGAVLDKAERAWEQKNWTLAFELYSKAESALDDTQRRRLAFLRARKGAP